MAGDVLQMATYVWESNKARAHFTHVSSFTTAWPIPTRKLEGALAYYLHQFSLCDFAMDIHLVLDGYNLEVGIKPLAHKIDTFKLEHNCFQISPSSFALLHLLVYFCATFHMLKLWVEAAD